MGMLPLSEVGRLVGGRLHGADAEIAGVSTDTRSLRRGDLFVALKGPNFDGHDYLGVALGQGAAGALVERPDATGFGQVEVDDTLAGLGRLAHGWRRRCPATVIAITGSNGKTTLKEMTAAILAEQGGVLATRGNLNNDIGVPLTLCRLRREPFAVIEMGANHPGEIAYLTGLAAPDVAVLNNAGRAHLEGFGSLEGVARAKAEIVQGLGEGGVFVFNADDRFAPLWRELSAKHRSRTFGVVQPADVSSPEGDYQVSWQAGTFAARFPVDTGDGRIDISLRLAGEHNRLNALAAIAAATQVGASLIDAQRALAALGPVPGRLCPLPGLAGSRLIDDSYNANPDSVIAALHVLAAAPGRRTLVLGDLAELGPDAPAIHRRLGESCDRAGIDRLLTVGEMSRAASEVFAGERRHFASREAAVECLLATLSDEDSILVKGSRASRMDQVVAALRPKDVGVAGS